MRYKYNVGIDKKRPLAKRWLFLPIAGLGVGCYVLANVLWPALPANVIEGDVVAKKLTSQQPDLRENRLYIPQIGVDVAIVDIKGDEAAALERGAIHRSPESGNPEGGGNFVVAAHRFQIGYTPAQTRLKSPFYHIDKLKGGDQFYVDYNGKRYAYEVDGKKSVPPNATKIEQRTDQPTLTMYSCDLMNPHNIREVITAKPVGTIAWVNGEPKLQSL